ncbi:MAG: hypothetical protein IJ833_05270 [Lachnospiraceae bacterium]|nr:hypothetical protein [Lachnospiraceae bacterium]
MTVEMLQTISLIGYIMSGIFLAVTIILFFVLKVPKLVGDISGATARKAIEDIRQQTENSRMGEISKVNLSRGKLTDKISASGRLLHNTGNLGVSVVTQKISTQELSPETTMLLSEDFGETTVLWQPAETTILAESFNSEATGYARREGILQIEVDIGFWESNEWID